VTTSGNAPDRARERRHDGANPEIAERLTVSDAAVAKHIGNVFAKLGLTVDDAGHRRVRAVLAYLRR
jgi:DNA-binding NarL/FixJ family response regulator